MNASAAEGMKRYKYQAWDGGPHIVVPQTVISSWKGHELNVSDPLDPATDYGRACSIAGEFDLVDVGEGQALVLQNPAMVAWSPESSKDKIDIFILQGWSNLDLDSLLDKAIEHPAFTPTDKSWNISGDLLRIHFAGDDPEQPQAGRIDIPCRTGKYQILSSNYSSDLGNVILIRLAADAE